MYRYTHIESVNTNLYGNTVHVCLYVYECMTVFKRVTVCIYIFVHACVCMRVLCMNNSRHAMLSAEASAPDRGWNSHASLVGRGLMRNHRRPGEREKTAKNWRRSRFKADFLRLRSNYPSCLTNFNLKGNVSGIKKMCVMCHRLGTHLKKENILATVFWFKKNTYITTQRLSVYRSDVETSESCPRQLENLLNEVEVETEKKSRFLPSSASHYCER